MNATPGLTPYIPALIGRGFTAKWLKLVNVSRDERDTSKKTTKYWTKTQ